MASAIASGGGSIAKDPELDSCSYLVTKHSWKGKYKRILSIGSTGISTYNPDKFDITNRWPHSDVLSAAPNKAGNVSLIDIITIFSIITKAGDCDLILIFPIQTYYDYSLHLI